VRVEAEDGAQVREVAQLQYSESKTLLFEDLRTEFKFKTILPRWKSEIIKDYFSNTVHRDRRSTVCAGQQELKPEFRGFYRILSRLRSYSNFRKYKGVRSTKCDRGPYYPDWTSCYDTEDAFFEIWKASQARNAILLSRIPGFSEVTDSVAWVRGICTLMGLHHRTRYCRERSGGFAARCDAST